MTARRNRKTKQAGSLRRRLTREILVALVLLIVSFAATTLAAITFHLYQDARRDAHTIAAAVTTRGRSSATALITAYSRSTDPEVWMLHGLTLVAHSPNAPPRPTTLGTSGLVFNPAPVYQDSVARGPFRIVVDWPLASDLTLLQELVLVVAVVTVLAIAAGVFLAYWTTRRTLEPMKTMTEGVQAMLDTQSIKSLELPSGNDEFVQLASLLNHLVQSLDRRWQQDRELIADAAHQLRTPLEVVRGNLDILRTWDDLDRETHDECLDAIDRTVTEISRIVGDVLTMEHAAGAGKTALSPLSLADLVREVGEDAGALAGIQGTPTTYWSVEEARKRPPVLANPDYARRALWAVTENALKYSGPAGRISLTVVPAPEGPFLGVVVRDSGPGISDTDLPNVFTRFYRGTTVRQIPGTGLGLSLAKALMEAQRGTIQLNSGPNGTTVTLWFHLADSMPEHLLTGMAAGWSETSAL